VLGLDPEMLSVSQLPPPDFFTSYGSVPFPLVPFFLLLPPFELPGIATPASQPLFPRALSESERPPPPDFFHATDSTKKDSPLSGIPPTFNIHV